jgi:hypothetical protein
MTNPFWSPPQTGWRHYRSCPLRRWPGSSGALLDARANSTEPPAPAGLASRPASQILAKATAAATGHASELVFSQWGQAVTLQKPPHTVPAPGGSSSA